MAKNCTDSYTTNRSGSSQAQRVLQALLPQNIKVDDRDYADLILFAKRYAAFINYYNSNNVADGNWQALMKMDVSVTLAGIAKTDVTGYVDYLKFLYQNTKSTNVEAEIKKHFKTIFDFIFSVAVELDTYYRELPGDFEFREYFYSSIQASLQDPLYRVLRYYKDFVTAGYIDESSIYTSVNAPINIILSQNFNIDQLSSIWQIGTPPPVIELSVPNPADVSNSINHIITHNLFNAQRDSFFKSLSNLVTQSAGFLEQTLTNFPSHTPHYALFITFLHLFKKAQNQLNQFSGRHLDFYYKDILRLTTKPANPDTVHVIITLQKGVDQHLVKQGTLFKAGKNIDGIEINYAADEETVINRAEIKSLQALQVQVNTKDGKIFETVFASPVANSEDGQGGKLLSINKEWFPFGNPAKAKEAALGFIIASHYLYLKEATRTIKITCTFAENFSVTAAEVNTAFTIELTGKKDWFLVPTYTSAVNQSARTISFNMVLEGDAPAIIGYAEKLHKSNYATDLPVIRFNLKMEKNVHNIYSQLKDIQLNSIAIEVKVDGAKDLIIQNDEGALDPAKPFKPFGSQPKVGSSFIVGSKEIFQKELTRLSLVIDWDEVPDSLVDQLDEALHEYESTLSYLDVKRKFHTVKTFALNKGKWDLLDSQKGIFIEDNLYDIIFNWTRPDYKYAGKLTASDVENSVINITPNNINTNAPNFDKNEAFSNNSIDGFVKLQLNSPDFGHTAYPIALRNAAQSVSIAVTGAGTANMTMKVTPTATLPKEPYTPTVKSFSVNYTAATKIDLQVTTAALFEGKQANFFHLTPFGYARINKVLAAKTTLLPLYTNNGELYIGIENLLPSSTLKVLFQIADGTSNPLKEENEVDWFYLSNNQWKAFENTDVIDATKNFTQSGIVTFVFHDDITTNNTLFEATLWWLKAVVKKDIDAVCKIINLHTQAIKLTLQSDAETGSIFKQAIPANTISKLLIGDAAIKKITQPYESFGGRVKEPADKFYTRVSERLRHKQRAIAAWDYEKLVLEKFPSIYKTKCINHTGFIAGKIAGTTKYSETAPGYVTVVTLPDMRNNAFKNPLKPYTSIGLLINIKDYLSGLTSPFVKLHVVNPRFEEVQFQFDVVITSPLDKNFYEKQLSLDIEKFLCPWAWDSGKDIEFGGKISKSVVLNFIEERHYVDYVTCFKMNQFVNRGTADHQEFYDIEEAQTTTGISILVSYFDELTNVRHLINAGVPCPC